MGALGATQAEPASNLYYTLQSSMSKTPNRTDFNCQPTYSVTLSFLCLLQVDRICVLLSFAVDLIDRVNIMGQCANAWNLFSDDLADEFDDTDVEGDNMDLDKEEQYDNSQIIFPEHCGNFM